MKIRCWYDKNVRWTPFFFHNFWRSELLKSWHAQFWLGKICIYVMSR